MDDDPEIIAQMAKVYMLNGQFETAARYSQRVLERQDLTPSAKKKALETQAFLHFRSGRLPDAHSALSQALKLEKPWKSAKLHFGLAGIRIEQMREKPSPLSWLYCLGHFVMGTVLTPVKETMTFAKPSLLMMLSLSLKRFQTQDKTLETLLELYQLYPGFEGFTLEIGKLFAEQEHYTEAEFWFCRAMYRHPARDEGYRSLVNLYQRTNNNEQLIDILRRWMTIRPESGEIMMVLSQALAQNVDNFEEAIRYAKQALINLKAPAMLATTYTHLGNMYSHMQAVDTAILAYQSAINIYPNCMDTYVQLGTLYYDRQEYLLSQKTFEKALMLSPENPKILCNLGYLAWMQGNISQAMDYYHQSIALDPAYDIALNNLGVLYLDHIGDLSKAMDLFDQTLLHNPAYALCHYNKGRAYSFLGKTIEAARCFQHAQELNECSNELDSRELTERIKQLFEDSEQTFKTDL
jgi:tetratricopeptide (TPR) repeat protein